MAAPSKQVSRQRFLAQQALSLLEKWNADDEIDSDSSSASDESETSETEADTAAVADRSHGAHSLALASKSSLTSLMVRPKSKKARRGQRVEGRETNIKKRDEPNPWVDVSTTVSDATGQCFWFLPPRPPGISVNLDHRATPLDCLLTLLSPDMLDNMTYFFAVLAIYKLY